MSGKHRAGKHREPSRGRSAVLRRSVPGLTAVAVGAASVSTALMTATSATVAALPVTLAALVTPANSTAQIFASSSYYNQPWTTTYGQPQVVPFFLGPQGIADAIHATGGDPNGVVVLASGWGAGQTGTALGILQANGDTSLNNVKLVVLDNNSNRAGGGFWTTYAPFAPLLFTSAAPTPSNLNVPVVDVAYEYNINSDAPTYPLNVIADANSLVAYVYGYGGQATAPVPQDLLTTSVAAGDQHYHYVLDSNGNIVNQYDVPGNITYVTFQTNGLPLVQPLRSIPGGNVLADAVEPALTVLVNAGYQGNNPIPTDPSATRSMGLLPSASESTTAMNQLPGAVQQGLQAAQKDLSSPTGTVTGPFTSLTGQKTSWVASTPVVPPVVTTVPTLTKPLRSPIDMSGGNQVSPGASISSRSSSSGAHPVQQLVGSVSSALSGLAGSLTNGAQKGEPTTTASGTSGSSGSEGASH